MAATELKSAEFVKLLPLVKKLTFLVKKLLILALAGTRFGNTTPADFDVIYTPATPYTRLFGHPTVHISTSHISVDCALLPPSMPSQLASALQRVPLAHRGRGEGVPSHATRKAALQSKVPKSRERNAAPPPRKGLASRFPPPPVKPEL